jgi:hypothetical protein
MVDYLDIINPQPFRFECDGEIVCIDPINLLDWFRNEPRVRESLLLYYQGNWGSALELLADVFESLSGIDPRDWSMDSLVILGEFAVFFLGVYMPPELMENAGKDAEERKHKNELLLELESVITTQLSLAEFRSLTFSHALVLYKRIREEQAKLFEVMWFSGEMGWAREEKQAGDKIIASFKPRGLPWALPWQGKQIATPRSTPAPPDEKHLSPFIRNPGMVLDLKKGARVGEKTQEGR